MKKRKIFLILLYIFVFILFSYLLDRVIIYIYQLKQVPSYVSVTDNTSIDNVYIDGNLLCKTPCINKGLNEGLHEVKISRIDNPTLYYTFKESLLFEKNSNNLINIILGPNLEYTYYSVYLLKQIPKNEAHILIDINNPGKTDKINLEDKVLQNDNESILEDKTYELDIKRARYQDYQSKVTLNKGYLTYILIHQAKKPF